MTKQQLIRELLKEVEKHLEQNILDQFDNFNIENNLGKWGVIHIECYDKTNKCRNSCRFEFNWYN
jgi:hypothetical protein